MKRKLMLLMLLMTVNSVFAQEWMTSFEIAKRLAVTQNKMLFVMWENSTDFPLPVILKDQNGKIIFIENMFEDEELNAVIWENFVPVLLNESNYDDWYNDIENRTFSYKERFRDDSIKIMDVNGNILNISYINYDPLNFTEFMQRYALDTSFLEQEYRNYQNENDFYTSFYLGTKYLDYAIYASNEIRPELVKLSEIYFKEAEDFLEQQNYDKEEMLYERLELMRIKQELLIKKFKRVLRMLRKFDTSNMSVTNKPLLAFLYYTAYKLDRDNKNTDLWKTEVSLVNLKKAEFIIKRFKE